ncbi:MAG: DoxX family membrane protein [Desulfobacteraceae bacterium]|nr:DoxX family membrane protein [Desulfobacteraceae bacterium]
MITYYLRRIITSEYLALALRIYIGYFFIYASVSKIPYPAQFAEAIANYRLLPFSVLNLGAVILPWIELVSGLFLIIGFKSRASVVVIGLLLIMFDVMILINMFWGAPITCGCYDTVGEPIGWKKISENALMLLFTFQIYRYNRLMLFSKWGVMVGAKKRVASPVTQ